MVKINQMKKDELFEGFYLIKSADVRQTRAGKNYLAFVFQDETGTIEGKLWDAQPHNVEQFQAGRVVHMSGRREVYNNTPQVNQLTLRLPQSGEPSNPADFKEKRFERLPVGDDFQNRKSGLATCGEGALQQVRQRVLLLSCGQNQPPCL